MISNNSVDKTETSNDSEWLYYPLNIEELVKPWVYNEYFLPTIMTYGLTFLIGVVGNGLVIFAMIGDRKSRSVATTFLASLAAADLLFLLICVPYQIVKLFGKEPAEAALCKLFRFVEMLAAVLTILNLMAVSVERYVVIVHPVRARYICTMGSAKKIVLTVWLVSVALSSPMLYMVDSTTHKYYQNETRVIVPDCNDNKAVSDGGLIAFVWYQFLVMYVLPTIVMIFCYTQVIKALWSSTHELMRLTSVQRKNSISNLNNDFNDEARQSLTMSDSQKRQLKGNPVKDHSTCIREARKQVIKMLITIIIVFLICWGPQLVCNIMKKHRALTISLASVYFQIAFSLLPYIQSSLNPIIYGFMSTKFRKSMKTACQIYICRTKSCCSGHRYSPDHEMYSKNVTTHTQHSHLSPSTSNIGGSRYAEQLVRLESNGNGVNMAA